LLGLFFVLYPASVWVLFSPLTGRRRRLVTACAAIIAAIGGIGAIGTMKDFEWPPGWGDFVGLLLWLLPVLCGLLGLARAMRRKGEGES